MTIPSRRGTNLFLLALLALFYLLCPCLSSLDSEKQQGDCQDDNKDASATTCTPNNDSDSDDDSDNWFDLLSRIHTNKFFVNGSWTFPHSKETLPVVDPSNQQVLVHLAAGDQEDTDRAVQAAHAAFPHWSLDTTSQQRQGHVQRLLELYQEHQDDFAALIAREMGSPVDMARESQVGAGVYHIEATLELYANHFEAVRSLPNIHVEDNDNSICELQTTILMDPVGVVAAITPWNWPLNQITIKIIPALLVGCTVVLKPSENSPLSALLLADLVRQAGFPPGVFNVVNGAGPVVGQQLSSHPLVDMVSFTGSPRAGAQVSRAAADTFKKVSLELGGKGATLIFDDVGEEWAEEILENSAGGFYNSGQSCNYASRLLVQRSLYPRAIDLARQQAEETRVDSAHRAGHDHIGPVANQVQYQRIQDFIQSGLDQGATLVAGGLGKPDHLKDSPGAYVRPTVFADCTPDMDIFREEIFGPVLCITPFDTEEEAIVLTNDTPYGLSNYVYTSNRARQRRLSWAIKSGQVEINDEENDFGTPFGGVKASGIGREGGIYGLEEFCEIKSVTGYPHEGCEPEEEEQ